MNTAMHRSDMRRLTFMRHRRSGLWPMVRSSKALSTVAKASPGSPAQQAEGSLREKKSCSHPVHTDTPSDNWKGICNGRTGVSKLVLAALAAVVHIVDGQHDTRSRQPTGMVHVPSTMNTPLLPFQSLSKTTMHGHGLLQDTKRSPWEKLRSHYENGKRS